MEIKRITTEDGSDSLYVPELDETYHSTHGAIQESSHVFIKHGLEYCLHNYELDKLKILEFGFGTGLNALLTAIYQSSLQIEYTSLEKYPVPADEAVELNYGKIIGNKELFERLINAPWQDWAAVSEVFRLFKNEIDFLEFIPEEEYNLIYFDAFAPSKQPELWSAEILAKCYNALGSNGIFVTYSAKGQVRRDLKQLGFEIERLPGPPGKFEMLRAIKV